MQHNYFKNKLIVLFLYFFYRNSNRQKLCHLFRGSCSKVTRSSQSHFANTDGSPLPNLLHSTLQGQSWLSRCSHSCFKSHITKATSRKYCVSLDYLVQGSYGLYKTKCLLYKIKNFQCTLILGQKFSTD